MTAKLEILELLENIRPDGRCDDCLSQELDIKPRQSVNIVCRSLNDEGRISRLRAACSLCGKVKLVNTLASPTQFQRVEERVGRRETEARPSDFDLEHARTDIVRICRSIWQRTQSAEMPRSISVVINQLRAAGALSHLHASLMLTLCSLRNAHVYEGASLGTHEMAVASHTAAALTEWWDSKR